MPTNDPTPTNHIEPTLLAILQHAATVPDELLSALLGGADPRCSRDLITTMIALAGEPRTSVVLAMHIPTGQPTEDPPAAYVSAKAPTPEAAMVLATTLVSALQANAATTPTAEA